LNAYGTDAEGLPDYTIQRLPLTAAIPYNFRWRILNLKLMLRDLQELADKHGIYNAGILYDTVCKETEELCAKLTSDILETRKRRAVYAKYE